MGRRGFWIGTSGTLVVVASCGSRSGLPVPPSRAADPQLVAACVKLLSCVALPVDSLFPGYADVSSCVWENLQPFARSGGMKTQLYTLASAACIAAARDCGAAGACVRGGTPLSCAQPVAPSVCSGPMALDCVDGQTLASDCTLGTATATDDPGSTCVVDDKGYALCGMGTCTGPPASPCDGNRSVTCRDGVLHGWSCPQGTTCGPAGADGVGCFGAGAACSAERCEGDEAVHCLEGHEWTFACERLPVRGTCAVDARGIADCVPSPGLACDPLAHADDCDGTRVIYCDGERRSVDCASLGFASCVAAGGSATCM